MMGVINHNGELKVFGMLFINFWGFTPLIEGTPEQCKQYIDGTHSKSTRRG